MDPIEKLEELKSDWNQVVDQCAPDAYRPVISDVIQYGNDCQQEPRSLEYWDLLENCVYHLLNAWGNGTLTCEQRQTIFTMAQEDWPQKASTELASELRAAISSCVTTLIPHPGTREWLQQLADAENDNRYKEFLARCAATERNEFLI